MGLAMRSPGAPATRVAREERSDGRTGERGSDKNFLIRYSRKINYFPTMGARVFEETMLSLLEGVI